MIEDKATEKLKKRLKDIGLIVNMGAGSAKPAETEKRATNSKSRTSAGKKKGGQK